MIRKLLIILIVALGTNLSKAQNYPSDCITAVTVCGNDVLNFQSNTGSGNVIDFSSSNHNVSNPSSNPASTNAGCLYAGEINSYWVLIHIATYGTLEFNIAAGLQAAAFDWIMWKYDTATCSGIFNNTLAPVRCNWNSTFNGCGTGIGPVPPNAIGSNCQSNYEPTLNVIAGESYILCISNFTSSAMQIPINFTGTAQLLCSPSFTLVGDTICEGQTAFIRALGGANLDWSANNGINLINNHTAWATPTTTTQYIVSRNLSSTITVFDTTTVVVLPASDPQCQTSCTININQPNTVCEGSPLLITADTLLGYNYNWIAPNGNFSNSQVMSFQSIPLWNDSLVVLIVDSGLTQCTDTVSLSVLPKPYISITPPTDTICSGDTVHFTFSGANWYTISPANGIYNYQMNGFSAVLYVSETYQIHGFIPNGCFDMKYLYVYVKPTIIPTISYTNNVLTTNATQVTYQWNLNGVPIPGANSASYVPQQNGSYTLTVTNLYNCTKTSQPIMVTNVGEIELQEEETIFVIYPNPANDVINVMPNIRSINIKVYDASGKMVFTGVNEYEINVSNFNRGFYILQIESETVISRHKFVKE